MAATARLASHARPLSSPNPSVAAMLVSDGKVISTGLTQAGGRPHAEARALAGVEAEAVKSATLYVTLEPCAHESTKGPACADLVVSSRPSRVVIGQPDPDPRTAGIGAKRIEKAGIDVSVLNDAASRKSLAGYLCRAEHGRPYVTLKLAMSLDGCIALNDGSSHWITGDAARAHVHAHRAKQDAILVGGGTWRADKPRLDVRLPGIEDRSPSRVLLSRGVPPDGVRVINQPEQIADLDAVQYLYVEGGAMAAASFLERDLVDELHIYRAPILIGEGKHAVANLSLPNLSCAHGRWVESDSRRLGSDHFNAYLRTR